MKHSNFVTPRTSGECNWIVSDDPIDRPLRGHARYGLAWIIVVLAATGLAILVTVPIK